jgi:alkylmercury lyase-like protein
MSMPQADELRIHIYDRLLAAGQPPTIQELAAHFRASDAEARRWIADLKIGKTILPHPQTGEIWMAGPFASTKTPYRVAGQRVTWWANCAWDMLGVAMISRESVRIDSQCTDCGEPLTLRSGPNERPDFDGVVHFLVPARHWYDDIGFT